MSIRRDYKSATAKQRRQSARRHGLLVITLVLIGLFGGLLAYIKGDRTQQPAPTAAVAPPTPSPPSSASPAPPKAVVAPVAEPAPARPKYDFYTELPKRQIDIRREPVNPKNAPPPLPARTQPAVDPLRKPVAPRKNTTTTTPTVAAVNGVKPNAKPNAKSTPPKPATATGSASSRPANARPINPKPAVAEPVNPKPATTPVSTRRVQSPRPLASNDSKIAVKAD